MATPIVGNEMTVNAGVAGDQRLPTVAALVTGRFVLAWSNGSSSYGTGYGNRLGTGVDTSSTIEVGGAATTAENRIEATGLNNGSVAVAYVDTMLNGGDVMMSYRNPFMREEATQNLSVYGATNEAGPECNINIGLDRDGLLLVSYYDVDDGQQGNMAFPANADPRVSFPTNRPGITQLDVDVTGFGTSIWRETSTGNIVTSYQTNFGPGSDPYIVELSDRNAAAVWTAGGDVKFSIFSATSSDVDFGPITISSGFVAGSPHLTDMDDGRIFVAWVETFFVVGPSSSQTNTIRGQIFNPDGTASTEAFTIDSLTAASGVQTGAPRTDQLADGRLIVTYQDGVAGSLDIKVRIIDARTGPVTLAGTPFDDSFVGTPFNDTIFVGVGNDTVQAGGGDDFIVGGTGANDLRGEDGNDTIDNRGGTGSMDGGSGRDRFIQGLSGTIVGGPDTDLVDFSFSSARVWVDLATSLTNFWTYRLGAWVASGGASGVEDVLGSALGDTLIGDAQNNWLQGGNGDDQLYYTAGFDWLWGDAGSDTANFSRLGMPIWVDLLSGGTQEAWTRGSTLQTGTWVAVADLAGIENLTGTAYADYLRGDGLANVLSGGGGDDQLLGEAGNDTFVYGGGFDTVDGGADLDTADFSAQASVWVDLGAGQAPEAWQFVNGAWVALAELTGVEYVVGTAGADYLQGDAGNNWLQGMAGADTLAYTAGFDWLYGGSEVDTADFSLLSKPVWVDMDAAGYEVWARGATLDTGTWAAIADLLSVENITGSAFADYLEGDGGANWLQGRAGADTFVGSLGQDRYSSGADGDTLIFRTLAEISTGLTLADRFDDFQTGVDKIDLRQLDAGSGLGRQAFTFNNSGAEATVSFVAGDGLYFYTNATAGADYTLKITGTVVAGDLLLF